jgi:hypothetical protein
MCPQLTRAQVEQVAASIRSFTSAEALCVEA